jgi:hypothetical protein
LTYVADLYGIKENKVSEKLNELFECFDIDSSATYNFVAYTEKSTDSTLKFALLDADKQELFSYVKSNTYRQYNYLSNNKTKSITIDGKINEDCKYVIKGDDATYEFSYNNTGSEITGDIKITNIEDNTVIVDGTYSCSYKTSNGITSMSLVIDYDYTCEKEIADVTINSSILINPNVDLNEISKSEYKNAYTAQNTDFGDIVISMLDTLNSKYNEQLGN